MLSRKLVVTEKPVCFRRNSDESGFLHSCRIHVESEIGVASKNGCLGSCFFYADVHSLISHHGPMGILLIRFFKLISLFAVFGGLGLGQPIATSGPSGGEVSKIIVHPYNPDIVYAIVSWPFTAVFKSTNGGGFWRALTNGLEFDFYDGDTRWLSDIDIDKSHPETLYVSINQAGYDGPSVVYRSTDGGEDWSPVKTDRIYSMWADNGAILALNTVGLIFSGDAGNSWSLRNGNLQGGKLLVDNQGVLWVAGDSGFFRSPDLGFTYQKLAIPHPTSINTFDVSSIGNQKLVAVAGDSLYLSYDNGTTWSIRTRTFGSPALKISRQNNNVLYGAGLGGVVRSSDAGVSWMLEDSGLVLPHAMQPSNYQPIVRSLAVCSVDSNTIYAGTTYDGIYRSTDQGISWKFLSAPTGGVVSLSRSANTGNPIVASSGGIYSFQRNEWVPTSMLIGQIAVNFTAMSASPYNPAVIICAVENSVFGGDIFQTVDTGASWKLVTSTPGEGTFTRVQFDPVDSNRVYATAKWFGGGGTILVSDNQGATWHYLYGASNFSPNDIAIEQCNNRIVYVLEANGAIRLSTDRGNSWTQIRVSNDSLHTTLRIDPKNPSTLYLGSFSLFKSVDSGYTWLRTPFDKMVTDIAFDSETDNVFVGTFKQGVWKSADGGMTFQKMSDLPSSRITSLFFTICNQHRLLYAGTAGVGAYYYDFGPVTPFSVDVVMNNRWNLVSLPLNVADSSRSAVYPDAVSNAFSYNRGYQQEDTLRTGLGYWLKFPHSDTVGITGTPILAETISVTQGWHLVGSISDNLSTDSVITLPSNLGVSEFFGYDHGYSPASVITPGKGYWIKTRDSGKIILSSLGSISKSSSTNRNVEGLSDYARLLVRDAGGGNQILYFGAMPAAGIPVTQMEMPPIPPAGVFDARYQSQRMLEVVESGKGGEFPIQISSSEFPLTISWELHAQSLSAMLDIDGKTIPLTKNGSIRVIDKKSQIVLVLSGQGESPKEFALYQNFPNPFNSETIIQYDIGTQSIVKLSVYDVLGREVAKLVNAPKQPGGYNVILNASNLSSGVYVYQITAGSYSSSKKLILIK